MVLGISILVVDDDAQIRKTLSSILVEEGYSVETVESGTKAIRACEKTPFDVALIDIELPDMKGTQILNKLKRSQPKMVKIMITGFPSLDNAIKALNDGAEGYILKPFDVVQLLEMIRKHLNEKTAEDIRVWAEKSKEEQARIRFSEQFKKKSGSMFTR